MIRLAVQELPTPTVQKLAKYQQLVLDAGDYTSQVAKAKALFKQHNKANNAAFKIVREKLAEMCVGPKRCNYCEDSVADEVEHIAPKDLFPEQCFSWNNYCYACGPCNGPKSNRYAVFRQDQNESFYEIPEHGDPPLIRPPLGQHVLINPREEDPLQFMLLDLQAKTFRFAPLMDEGSLSYQRADYTIRILNLNTRGDLISARRNAYTNFRARLREYIHDRDHDAPGSHLNELRQNFSDESHQTVWQEMKRQYQFLPELQQLFGEAPEAFAW